MSVFVTSWLLMTSWTIGSLCISTQRYLAGQQINVDLYIVKCWPDINQSKRSLHWRRGTMKVMQDTTGCRKAESRLISDHWLGQCSPMYDNWNICDWFSNSTSLKKKRMVKTEDSWDDIAAGQRIRLNRLYNVTCSTWASADRLLPKETSILVGGGGLKYQ